MINPSWNSWNTVKKSRLVFDLGIRLTVIQKHAGTDEGNGNKCWACIGFPHKNFCCRYHAQLSNEITVCLKYNWCLRISKVVICMFGQNIRVHLYVFTSKLHNFSDFSGTDSRATHMPKWGECAIIVEGEYFIRIWIIKFSNSVTFCI